MILHSSPPHMLTTLLWFGGRSESFPRIDTEQISSKTCFQKAQVRRDTSINLVFEKEQADHLWLDTKHPILFYKNHQRPAEEERLTTPLNARTIFSVLCVPCWKFKKACELPFSPGPVICPAHLTFCSSCEM